MTIKEKKKKLIEEFSKEISSLENIAKAIHAKGIVAGQDGTIDIKMSPNQLKELAEVKNQIFSMKRRLLDLEEKFEDEDELD